MFALPVLSTLLVALLLFVVGLLYRTYVALCPIPPSRKRRRNDTCPTSIFLGSGGHTAEMISMLSSLDFQRYQPRLYILGKGDHLSEVKVHELEASKGSESYTIFTVPRARRVHQPLLATPPTAIWSFLYCFWIIFRPAMLLGRPASELMLLNGPGTCSTLCLAVFICRMLALKTPRLVYIESFTRVNSLSLSGKLVYPLVDRFVVQWQELRDKVPGTVCKGWLV